MDDPVTAEFIAHRRGAIGLEIERLQPGSADSDGQDGVGFISREGEARESSLIIGPHTSDGALKLRGQAAGWRGLLLKLSAGACGAALTARCYTLVVRLEDRISQHRDSVSGELSARNLASNHGERRG